MCSSCTLHRCAMFVSQPFESLLERVYITMLDLDSAVAEVERGLQVLDKGLDTIETDVYNGRLQLYGTGKVNALQIAVVLFRTRKSYRGSVAQCEVSAYAPIVVDAALRRIGKSRHGGHKSANVSLSCQRI